MEEEEVYPIPKDLNDCFTVINLIMSNSDPKESEWFKNTEEKEVLSTVHHGFGTWIRNTWGLWNKESNMYKYFLEMGLWHADDMSNVILTSYHRFINGKELELQEQIKHYLNFWIDYEKTNGPIEK